MATRWNDIKTYRAARNRDISGIPQPTPEDFTDLGKISKIEVNGITYEPSFLIPGVAPQRADLFEPVQEEPIERWPARVRPVGFEKNYTYIDPDLDSELVQSQGLTYNSGSQTWVGYYPGLTSNTQVGIVSQFQVGIPISFTIAGRTLEGTAYTTGSLVYGLDGSSAGTDWNGTISSVNTTTNSFIVVPGYISREIGLGDPTQVWAITHTAAEEGGAEPE